MTIIPDAMDESAVDKPLPIPRPLRIPDVEPALQERPPVIVAPAAYEIIRRAIESLP